MIKAHETPAGTRGGMLPVDAMPDVRFIAMARPLEDVMRSFVPFSADHEDHVRATWGGFPPVFPSVEAALSAMLPGGAFAPLVFDYLLGWWAFRGRPNVLLLHYDEAVRDLPAVVARVAAFLGVPLTPAQQRRIAELASFREMAKIAAKFDYRLLLHPHNDRLTMMRSGKLLRSGSSGEGAAFFSGKRGVFLVVVIWGDVFLTKLSLAIKIAEQLVRIQAVVNATLPADAVAWLYSFQG